MTPQKRMTLLTGSKSGFTFVEVMVAMVILAAGIVAVYRSFFLCVDYLNNISSRWWASELIEEKISEISMQLKKDTKTAIDLDSPPRIITINNRPIRFQYAIQLIPFNDLDGINRLDVSLDWNDGRRSMHLNRSVYLIK